MGGWGRDWLAHAIPEVAEVELVGCVDGDPEALAAARRVDPALAGRCFTTFEEAVAAAQPEAVLVTTPLPAHVPVVRAALEAGAHVLVEKPFAPSVAEARDVVELARARER